MKLFFDRYGKHHPIKGETKEGFQATLIDQLDVMKRGPQIITNKDAGLILGFTGVSSGWKVLEAGSGSGALTMHLANAVKPSGKVYSLDLRKEHQSIAKENIANAGLMEFVEFREADVTKKLDLKELDLIVFDFPEPWKALKNAEKCLREGGFLVCYVPSFEQLKETYLELQKHKFVRLKAVECFLREFQVTERATRPENVGLMHTGYLLFARKL